MYLCFINLFVIVERNKVQAMIQLSNIKFESITKLFNNQSKKLIRFSYKNSIITSKKICVVVNQATITWDEKLKLPEVYNQDIQFQIYNQHQFGYNPEELQSLLYGTIKILQGKTMGKWEVFNSADAQKRAGFLLMDFRRLAKQNSQPKNEGAQSTKLVSSILVRNLSKPIEKGYIKVNNGKKNYKSQTVEAIKGELFYNTMFKNNDYLIKSNDPKDVLTVLFFDSEDKQVGKSCYRFNNQSNLIKEDILDSFDNKVGQMYYQIEKQQISNVRAQSKEPNAQGKAPLKSSQSKVTLSKLRALSTTSLSRLGESQFLRTSRKKRVSIVHNNNDVVFPSQKRFMVYQDKQTDIISYSKLPSMKFESVQTKKYYKGASIGKGNKSDFTEYYRHNPGVGQYKLPSIFDRY